jgi:S1-C subfamily serine protease
MERASPLLSIDKISVPDAPATGNTSMPPARRPFWRPPIGPGRRVFWGLAALLVVVLIVVAVLVWRSGDDGPAPLTQADVSKAVQTALAQQQQQQRAAPPDAAGAYQKILPSLVTVVDSQASPQSDSKPKATKAKAKTELGAGVVINAQGEIITALHVIAGGGRITVQFADGTRSDATVAKRVPASDIAVLSVDQLPSVVVPAVMGGGAGIGDPVFAVGNPLGLQNTLTAGVVSALDRAITTQTGATLKGLIQFDAAVNPGNSGGPLLDKDGHVVGIVTGLANPSEQAFFVGLGFAVPIATAGGIAGGPSK